MSKASLVGILVACRCACGSSGAAESQAVWLLWHWSGPPPGAVASGACPGCSAVAVVSLRCCRALVAEAADRALAWWVLCSGCGSSGAATCPGVVFVVSAACHLVRRRAVLVGAAWRWWCRRVLCGVSRWCVGGVPWLGGVLWCGCGSIGAAKGFRRGSCGPAGHLVQRRAVLVRAARCWWWRVLCGVSQWCVVGRQRH